MTANLTARQRAFVLEYAVDRNGTRAAIRAGYSERGARVQACRMLTNANIQAEIDQSTIAQAERTEIDADWVQGELVKIVDRAKGAEAVPALAMIAKRTGGFVERGPLDFAQEGARVRSVELRVVYDTEGGD